MERSEERALIERIKAGEVHAFRTLVEAHQGRAYVVALRMVLVPELAEEIVQDAFVQAFRKLDTFRGEAAFGTWLHRILTRCCLSYLRQNKTWTQALEIRDTHQSVANQGMRDLEQEDIQSQVRQSLAQLPAKERLTLQLYYLDELSVREICEQTGWSTPNVKVLLHRGRKHFRALFPNFDLYVSHHHAS